MHLKVRCTNLSGAFDTSHTTSTYWLSDCNLTQNCKMQSITWSNGCIFGLHHPQDACSFGDIQSRGTKMEQTINLVKVQNCQVSNHYTWYPYPHSPHKFEFSPNPLTFSQCSSVFFSLWVEVNVTKCLWCKTDNFSAYIYNKFWNSYHFIKYILIYNL